MSNDEWQSFQMFFCVILFLILFSALILSYLPYRLF
jgi:hypothetical protein